MFSSVFITHESLSWLVIDAPAFDTDHVQASDSTTLDRENCAPSPEKIDETPDILGRGLTAISLVILIFGFEVQVAVMVKVEAVSRFGLSVLKIPVDEPIVPETEAPAVPLHSQSHALEAPFSTML